MEIELAIIGGGPAAYSAGIYAVRAGIKPIIFEKDGGGGLAIFSPNIENYPGFESISGIDLMEKMRLQAKKYCEIRTFEKVKKIQKNNNDFYIETIKEKYKSKAVIISTGSEYKKLKIQGESELQGKGVSYCATCDGFFFKDKKVAVIGGGNSALIEAIYLKQIGCKEVVLIHRRDQLRAEKAYEEEAKKNNIKFLFNKNVIKINGSEKVETISVKDVINLKETKLKINGVFISIGEIPQNLIAKEMNIKLDEKGYIIVDKNQRTNIKGVYAAGDITGGLRQIITACAEGA
ncbi:MAG: thioredoxin-disulfide reductase, partial [Thermoplasmatales archaeon]|nr:thioredoxin-disulfide reductase [Thermoplasmatales archaeon]